MRQEVAMQRQQDNVEHDAAVANLYQRHAPSLFAYLSMHTETREDARDLLVEIFLAAIEGARFKELREEEQRAWLWRVARNKVADHFRHRKRRSTLPLDDVTEKMYASEEPELLVLQREEYALLRRAIQRLSPLQQQVLHLRFVNNLPCADIALVLGKREGAVRMLLSRTLNLLRTLYKQHANGKES